MGRAWRVREAHYTPHSEKYLVHLHPSQTSSKSGLYNKSARPHALFQQMQQKHGHSLRRRHMLVPHFWAKTNVLLHIHEAQPPFSESQEKLNYKCGSNHKVCRSQHSWNVACSQMSCSAQLLGSLKTLLKACPVPKRKSNSPCRGFMTLFLLSDN